MNDSIPSVNSIFEQPWWLNAVAPGQWEAIEIRKDKEIVARLPYVKKHRWGFKLIGRPKYTQTLGIWIRDTGAKTTRKLERQKDYCFEIIKRIPKGYNIDLFLDHQCDYVLPFLWKGFHLSVAFSYRLEDISDEQRLWGDLRDNIKSDIRKAERVVTISDNMPISTLFDMLEKTFKRQGRKYNYDRSLLERLDEALSVHSARKLLCAVDENQRVHAAAYFVFDERTCYYLIGGGDPALRNSGATSLLIWEGIRFASSVSKSFDFEGSQIEDIERFFRAFGGKPTPYYHVTRLNPLLSLSGYLKPRIKRMLGYKI